MASSLQRLASNSGKAYRSAFAPLSRAFSTADSLVEIKPGEIGKVSGIPQEHLRRKVLYIHTYIFSYSQISGVVLYKFLKQIFVFSFSLLVVFVLDFLVWYAAIKWFTRGLVQIKCFSSIPSLRSFPLRWNLLKLLSSFFWVGGEVVWIGIYSYNLSQV